MGLHEGGVHLDRQLHSLFTQSHARWSLLASDDSIGEDSRTRLLRFAETVQQEVQLIEGPRQGFADNYLQLIRRARPGWLAFADQDDIWLPDKLARAVTMLSGVPDDQPSLYCARSAIWDGKSPAGDARATLAPGRALGFRNALIENMAQGNTILLNPAATALAQAACAGTETFFAHDWWLYLLITGVGGRVLFDAGPPVLLYRQHANNAIGAGSGARGQIARKWMVLRGAFGARISQNIAALRTCHGMLTPENAAVLEGFAQARARALPGRIAGLWRLGLYRQRPLGTLGFWGAAALGRV